MKSSGPYVPRKAPTAIAPPKGSVAIGEYGRSTWRSGIGLGVLMVGVVIVLLSAAFYARDPSEWLPDLYLAVFGVLLIALVLLVSWIGRRRIPPQKD